MYGNLQFIKKKIVNKIFVTFSLLVFTFSPKKHFSQNGPNIVSHCSVFTSTRRYLGLIQSFFVRSVLCEAQTFVAPPTCLDAQITRNDCISATRDDKVVLLVFFSLPNSAKFITLSSSIFLHI